MKADTIKRIEASLSGGRFVGHILSNLGALRAHQTGATALTNEEEKLLHANTLELMPAVIEVLASAGMALTNGPCSPKALELVLCIAECLHCVESTFEQVFGIPYDKHPRHNEFVKQYNDCVTLLSTTAEKIIAKKSPPGLTTPPRQSTPGSSSDIDPSLN